MEFKWRTKPLSKLIELIIDHRGKTPKKLGFEDFHDAGYPVLSAKHIKTGELVNVEGFRFANKSMYDKWMPVEIQEGDIVLTSEAPLGEVYYLNGKQKYVLGQRVFGLRTNPDILHPIYLVAWLTSSRGQASLNARATGSTVLGIKQSELLKINVDIPPPEIQNYIAEVYKNFSNKLELNRRINQTLEQIAQATFKSWFVDFEPVHAKIAAIAEGRDPIRAAMSAISGKDENALDNLPAEKYAELQATAELFPSALVDSELGKIPEGWCITPFSSIAKLDTTSIKPYENPNKEWVLYSIPAFDSNAFPVMELGKNIKSNKYSIKANSVLVSKLNPRFSRTWLPFEDYSNISICSTEFMQFIPLEKANRPFVYSMIKSARFQKEIMQRVTGSTGSRQRAQPKAVAVIPIVSPMKPLVQKFNMVTSVMLYQQLNHLKVTRRLSQLRDILLPKLLLGEITPPDIKTELTTT